MTRDTARRPSGGPRTPGLRRALPIDRGSGWGRRGLGGRPHLQGVPRDDQRTVLLPSKGVQLQVRLSSSAHLEIGETAPPSQGGPSQTHAPIPASGAGALGAGAPVVRAGPAPPLRRWDRARSRHCCSRHAGGEGRGPRGRGRAGQRQQRRPAPTSPLPGETGPRSPPPATEPRPFTNSPWCFHERQRGGDLAGRSCVAPRPAPEAREGSAGPAEAPATYTQGFPHRELL